MAFSLSLSLLSGESLSRSGGGMKGIEVINE